MKGKQDEQQLWDVVDKLDNSLGYIAPEDREMRRTKMFDAVFAGHALAAKRRDVSADRERLRHVIKDALIELNEIDPRDVDLNSVINTLCHLRDEREDCGEDLLRGKDTATLLDAIAEHLLDRAEVGK